MYPITFERTVNSTFKTSLNDRQELFLAAALLDFELPSMYENPLVYFYSIYYNINQKIIQIGKESPC